MNKIISIILVLVMLATVCVSCGKPDEEEGETTKVEETKVEICDECGVEISGEAKSLEYGNQTMTLCDECYETIKFLIELTYDNSDSSGLLD